MTNSVIKEIIKVTKNQENFLETEITREVSEKLKETKKGLFQNEVDYRILFPDFSPPDSEKEKYRADLIGFDKSGFSLIEFKIWDEEKKENKNPWGVFHYFDQDRKKLESAVEYNKKIKIR